ncbi:unnamed protein product [Protopolystoma xenopodis]|uniref:PDZ domain-containing protein n=1 Tax=Protopolystoma xenopodis TaxID=117903 RepID=A0A3S5AUC1_9PLAT|nr:unnamed protein product [Protopolystoma xenopodis]
MFLVEPGPRGIPCTGLLPGDRLLAVDGIDISVSSKTEVVDLVRRAIGSVRLTVQPAPELLEFSRRLLPEFVTAADELVVQGISLPTTITTSIMGRLNNLSALASRL